MLLLPGSMLALAVVIFTAAFALIRKEQKVGRRLFLVMLREWFDRGCEWVSRLCRRVVQVVGVSIMYIVHHVRAALARAIAPRPRKVRQRERIVYERTDNHLSSMHDHKSDTALTEAQKKKLRNQKLEERL